MSADRTLERTNPDWRLYVSDFPKDIWGDGFVAARLHVAPTARLKVEQQRDERVGELVWIAFGPHAQIFIPRVLASRLRELLDALFSAGASEGVATTPPAVSVDGLSSTTSTAPAEPSTGVSDDVR